MRRILVSITLALVCLCAPASAQPPDSDGGWPRVIQDGNRELTIYQPQIESWTNNRIEERSAVGVSTTGSAQPAYGVIWITARTEVDKSRHMVTLEDFQVTRAEFPTMPEQAAELQAAIQSKGSPLLRPIALDRLQSSLAISQAEQKQQAPDLKNNPPKIFFSSTPAYLLLIDGNPVLRDSGAPGILRVINSRSLVLIDQASGTYYLRLGGLWLSARDPSGPWERPEASPPALPALEEARKAAENAKLIDPVQDPNVLATLEAGRLPRVFESTIPAELIETNGTPQLASISGTRLLFVKNTENDLFLNTDDQNYYVLFSGRWYRSHSLEGSWGFVAAKQLPAEFSKIPETNPKGAVLSSVAGTAPAREAEINQQIPQTATIDRKQAKAEISYDGPPSFKPIEGTPLQYAVNSATPVIELGPQSYYAVQSGIWFAASSPAGPWMVATSVPPVIYTIPPSSPIYYVTYVYVYGYTPQFVYAGYLPGYLGAYTAPGGVVVFGTGYLYSPWVGQVWFGFPWTFGFGVTYYHPWWGPWGWATVHGPHYVSPGVIHPAFPVRPGPYGQTAAVAHVNVYRSWGPSTVRSSWNRTAPPPAQTGPRHEVSHFGVDRPNNVYADRAGNLYRHGGDGAWEHYSGANGWQATHRAPETRPEPAHPVQPRNAPESTLPREVEREQAAREAGEARIHPSPQGGLGAGNFGHSTTHRRGYS